MVPISETVRRRLRTAAMVPISDTVRRRLRAAAMVPISKTVRRRLRTAAMVHNRNRATAFENSSYGPYQKPCDGV